MSIIYFSFFFSLNMPCCLASNVYVNEEGKINCDLTQSETWYVENRVNRVISVIKNVSEVQNDLVHFEYLEAIAWMNHESEIEFI